MNPGEIILFVQSLGKINDRLAYVTCVTSCKRCTHMTSEPGGGAMFGATIDIVEPQTTMSV
jgi:hypothetical protein